MSENQLQTSNKVFTEEDFNNLPAAIQKYLQSCGYIGTPKMSYLKMKYHDVDFSQGKDRPALTIDYTQYNFVSDPCRMAFVDSSMFGIPFEGYDYYQNGTGGMKGVIAKAVTLFDQTGAGDHDLTGKDKHKSSILFNAYHPNAFLARDFSLNPLFIICSGTFRPPNGESGGTFCLHSGYVTKILFRFIIHTNWTFPAHYNEYPLFLCFS